MELFDKIGFMLHITRSHGIVRRYFVVNGFDGALTMLGILSGLYVGEAADLRLVMGACLGAAIALGMSGLSSAYISERAERRRALTQLEDAMVSDLGDTAHGQAARWVPLLVAAVNGLAPLLLSFIILLPIALSLMGVVLPLAPIPAAMLSALLVVFLMGAFLGRVGRTFWLISGIQTLLVAVLTVGLILVLG